jgi:23S rRNA (adenine2030-N6)-methyltransferase
MQYDERGMKYRHSYHAGNFADVHKHVALLALLAALKKKDKGFLCLDTHAGRGSYDLSSPSAEAAAGVARFLQAQHVAPELRAYAGLLRRFRAGSGRAHRYPGSPLLAALELRAQDRLVLFELLGAEAHALEEALRKLADVSGRDGPEVRIERGDGFERLRAFLPPAERRGLTLLDPPYEREEDFTRVISTLVEGLRRFPTGVFAAWYPIKEERAVERWHAGCVQSLRAPLLVSELWLYPRDSRVSLNGSGLLIVNPPWLTLERMQQWLPELQAALEVGAGAGSRAAMLSESPA